MLLGVIDDRKKSRTIYCARKWKKIITIGKKICFPFVTVLNVCWETGEKELVENCGTSHITLSNVYLFYPQKTVEIPTTSCKF